MTAEIKGIEKSYGKKSVLRGVSFSAERGDAVAIIGGNGRGKSTLLKCLAGILRPDAGSFLWEGAELLRSRELKSLVSYVPQGTPLIEELSARDNLRLWYSRGEMELSLEKGLLRDLGIDEFLKTRASRLSIGMRKRLTIACAIARDPQIILLDEPTASLDIAARERLWQFFDAHCARGGVMILVTHELRDIERSSKTLILRNGLAEEYNFSGDYTALAEAMEWS